ncbi:MAG: hypothetical protein HY582_04790, partial [Candidatus Omnitrophica bacterium]|nr:hypothetical protein [Candidatus Omnitrophota bacterium]
EQGRNENEIRLHEAHAKLEPWAFDDDSTAHQAARVLALTGKEQLKQGEQFLKNAQKHLDAVETLLAYETEKDLQERNAKKGIAGDSKTLFEARQRELKQDRRDVRRLIINVSAQLVYTARDLLHREKDYKQGDFREVMLNQKLLILERMRAALDYEEMEAKGSTDQEKMRKLRDIAAGKLMPERPESEFGNPYFKDVKNAVESSTGVKRKADRAALESQLHRLEKKWGGDSTVESINVGFLVTANRVAKEEENWLSKGLIPGKWGERLGFLKQFSGANLTALAALQPPSSPLDPTPVLNAMSAGIKFANLTPQGQKFFSRMSRYTAGISPDQFLDFTTASIGAFNSLQAFTRMPAGVDQASVGLDEWGMPTGRMTAGQVPQETQRQEVGQVPQAAGGVAKSGLGLLRSVADTFGGASNTHMTWDVEKIVVAGILLKIQGTKEEKIERTKTLIDILNREEAVLNQSYAHAMSRALIDFTSNYQNREIVQDHLKMLRNELSEMLIARMEAGMADDEKLAVLRTKIAQDEKSLQDFNQEIEKLAKTLESIFPFSAKEAQKVAEQMAQDVTEGKLSLKDTNGLRRYVEIVYRESEMDPFAQFKLLTSNVKSATNRYQLAYDEAKGLSVEFSGLTTPELFLVFHRLGFVPEQLGALDREKADQMAKDLGTQINEGRVEEIVEKFKKSAKAGLFQKEYLNRKVIAALYDVALAWSDIKNYEKDTKIYRENLANDIPRYFERLRLLQARIKQIDEDLKFREDRAKQEGAALDPSVVQFRLEQLTLKQALVNFQFEMARAILAFRETPDLEAMGKEISFGNTNLDQIDAYHAKLVASWGESGIDPVIEKGFDELAKPFQRTPDHDDEKIAAEASRALSVRIDPDVSLQAIQNARDKKAYLELNKVVVEAYQAKYGNRFWEQLKQDMSLILKGNEQGLSAGVNLYVGIGQLIKMKHLTDASGKEIAERVLIQALMDEGVKT